MIELLLCCCGATDCDPHIGGTLLISNQIGKPAMRCDLKHLYNNGKVTGRSIQNHGQRMSVADAVTSSLWFDQVGPLKIRPPLQGDIDVDVAIDGGGYSGLLTAYYLRQIDPTLRIQIIEKHYCGYCASGRNGGWAAGELAGSFES